ncbi:hypothetical protein BJ546DRAFT_1061369 [Cryomyces antarcticus]
MACHGQPTITVHSHHHQYTKPQFTMAIEGLCQPLTSCSSPRSPARNRRLARAASSEDDSTLERFRMCHSTASIFTRSERSAGVRKSLPDPGEDQGPSERILRLPRLMTASQKRSVHFRLGEPRKSLRDLGMSKAAMDMAALTRAIEDMEVNGNREGSGVVVDGGRSGIPPT